MTRRRTPGGAQPTSHGTTVSQPTSAGADRDAKDAPALSVVIPTHRRPATLRRALDHLARQTDLRFEVLVVDDAPDDEAAVTAAIDGPSRPFRVQRPRRASPGPAAARNAGIAAARAPLILLLGDDILADPDLVARHIAAHLNNPDPAVAVLGHIRWADELRITPFMRFLDEGVQFDYSHMAPGEVGWARLYSSNVSLKRELLVKVGGFDEHFPFPYEDIELARRLRDHGLRVFYDAKIRAQHFHPTTIESYRERMRACARAERAMVTRHPDFDPYFQNALAAWHGQPSSAAAHRLAEYVPDNLPILGRRLHTAARKHWKVELADAFFSVPRDTATDAPSPRTTMPIPRPTVSPDIYDEAYYREWCREYEAYNADPSAPIHGTYAYALTRARLQPGEILVDLGTGRGELLALASQLGAARAVGVEYSTAAVSLARETLVAQNVDAEVLHADARQIPLPDAMADLVTMLDVVEHLSPDELRRALSEAHRLLRPGGRLLIHTFPNRLIYDVTYRLLRLSTPKRWRWPTQPRGQIEAAMHVNEQTRTTLHRAVTHAGFADVRTSFGHQVYDQIIPAEDPRARTTLHRLAAHRLTQPLGRADLWAQATRSESP